MHLSYDYKRHVLFREMLFIQSYSGFNVYAHMFHRLFRLWCRRAQRSLMGTDPTLQTFSSEHDDAGISSISRSLLWSNWPLQAVGQDLRIKSLSDTKPVDCLSTPFIVGGSLWRSKCFLCHLQRKVCLHIWYGCQGFQMLEAWSDRYLAPRLSLQSDRSSVWLPSYKVARAGLHTGCFKLLLSFMGKGSKNLYRFRFLLLRPIHDRD